MRYYKKSNPEKPTLSKKSRKTDVVSSEFSDIPINVAEVNYRKKYGVKSPQAFFVIISGGEEREKKYFKIIANQDKFRRIKIKFIADPNQLNPDGMLEKAEDEQKRYQTSQGEQPDKFFIVSDVDHFMNDLLRIKPKCEKSNISLIISNSCFEIWLYYGKTKQRPTDFIIPEDYLKISRAFKNYLNNKFKGGIDPRHAIFDIEAAIANSHANYNEDNNGIPKLFSTNMFQLAKQLLPFIKDELSKMIADNKVKNQMFKKNYKIKILKSVIRNIISEIINFL
ncbi:MAG: RloB family protein [Planctomycetaceae bacterium]|jgi:hypothetical protein|nr:RloB family protein [Planctomycetaceae bacterium]